MSVRVIAYWETLFRLAREEVVARRSGDPEALRRAVEAHESYKKVMLSADETMLPGTRGFYV